MYPLGDSHDSLHLDDACLSLREFQGIFPKDQPDLLFATSCAVDSGELPLGPLGVPGSWDTWPAPCLGFGLKCRSRPYKNSLVVLG